jgi:restriction system protein
MDKLPTFDELMNPLLDALRELGGSGSNDEIYNKVIERLKLPESLVNIPHDPESGNITEIAYRLAWAKTYLKKYGILENSSRGIWSIAPSATEITRVDTKQVKRQVQQGKEQSPALSPEEPGVGKLMDEVPEEVQSWRTELHRILTTVLDPAGFERLTKRLLRESGFVQVEVTGKSGDGGIDGKGIARINGVLSFHVIFQCKRYSGVVTAGQIRDFRGAMVGRADKGLFITTGSFTRDAVNEATRDGAPPIDLIDGEQLMDMLKNLSLGVEIEIVEKVKVKEDWFKNI